MLPVQPYLHEAMRTILLDAPEHTATTRFLSEENVRRDLYRKVDGGHPLPSQFWLRARHHPTWFELLRPSKIKYIGPLERMPMQRRTEMLRRAGSALSTPIPRNRASVGLLSEIEEQRHKFRPTRITTLFIGESSPPGGTFFYYGNSKLHRAMKEAFSGGDDFCAEFKSKGFFLDDLVLFPEDKKTGAQQKEYLQQCKRNNYRNNVESLAQ